MSHRKQHEREIVCDGLEACDIVFAVSRLISWPYISYFWERPEINRLLVAHDWLLTSDQPTNTRCSGIMEIVFVDQRSVL
jgi:hypothetical protein